jgi:hypothetical protein
MKISEVVVKAPKGPLTPAQSRIHALKTRVKTSKDALKREQQTERARKALAALNPSRPT